MLQINLTPITCWRMEIKICGLQNMSLETPKIFTSALQRFVVKVHLTNVNEGKASTFYREEYFEKYKR